jgi:hypothetical protein
MVGYSVPAWRDTSKQMCQFWLEKAILALDLTYILWTDLACQYYVLHTV